MFLSVRMLKKDVKAEKVKEFSMVQYNRLLKNKDVLILVLTTLMAVGVLVFVDMVVIVIMFSVECSDNRDVHRDWDRNTMGKRMVDAGPEKTPCSVHSDGT